MALDVGGTRIGVAIANVIARIPNPTTTIYNTDTVFVDLKKLIDEYDVAVIVVGLPRNLNGQHTSQTVTVERFGAAVKSKFDLPLYWQDEALTSHKAKEELAGRAKGYQKEAVDALAATYILEDFLQDHPEVRA